MLLLNIILFSGEESRTNVKINAHKRLFLSPERVFEARLEKQGGIFVGMILSFRSFKKVLLKIRELSG